MTRHDDDDSEKKSRRDFLKASAAVATATAIASVEEEACAPLFRHVRPVNQPPQPHKVIIIGSGFGAMVAATTLAGLPNVNSVLILERGTFFTTRSARLRRFSPTPPPPNWPYWKTNHVQYWPTPDNDEGLRQSFLKFVRLDQGGDYFAHDRRARAPDCRSGENGPLNT
jgi:pimeloyl-ACP methyl ester carboxylesterase